MNLSKINTSTILSARKVFFIGIGGIGISAIARMMQLEGKEIFANDLEEFPMVSQLRTFGVDTKIGVDPSFIPKDIDLIVYSIAWDTLGPELLAHARTLGVPVLSYPEMLGIVSEGKTTIAVAGTHGKTTTTAMIGHTLRGAGKDPNMIVGSLMVGDRSNFWAGKSDLFVVEACEYRRSFLNINPTILVITNIEEDHLDYYKDLDDIISAFHSLAMKVPADGVIVCDPTDENVARAIEGVRARIVPAADFMTQRPLLLPGAHNQFDASLAVAVASVIGVSVTESTQAISTFPGTWRRFEYKGKIGSGAIVYDDYAHHPREIEVTASAFREKFPKEKFKLTVFFQPHLYSRTKSLFDGFVQSLSLFDVVYILPIYAAREVDDGSTSSEVLAQHIQENNINAQAISFDDAKRLILQDNFSDGDIVITMGAGEAYKIVEVLIS